MSDFELFEPPEDGISSLSFSSFTPSHLLATSWDRTVNLYDAVNNHLLTKLQFAAPVLDAAFSSSSSCYSAGLDCQVYKTDFNSGQSIPLGSHGKPVRCMNYSIHSSFAVSGSWDCSMKTWDSRASSPLITTITLPDRVYSMDIAQNTLIVGMANRLIHIFDTRKMSEPIQKRNSSLQFQTRCVRLFPNAEGFVCGTIEGRVSVDFINPDPSIQAQKYAFKCHRQAVESSSKSGRDEITEVVYPVNSLEFHPFFGTFASGGSDGVVNIWDRANRKRLKQYPKYHSSISALSFSSNGQMLAIASSYGYEEGEKDHSPDSIFIKTVNESEVKPKEIN